MSAAILDRARAFEMIAAHLSETRRAEIAEAIASKLLAEVGGAKPAASTAEPPRAQAPRDERRTEHDELAEFLAAHGYGGAELVHAAGRLTSFLTKHPELTREAGMRVWLRGAES